MIIMSCTSAQACQDKFHDLLGAIWGTDPISRKMQTKSRILQITATTDMHFLQDLLSGNAKIYREQQDERQ